MSDEYPGEEPGTAAPPGRQPADHAVDQGARAATMTAEHTRRVAAVAGSIAPRPQHPCSSEPEIAQGGEAESRGEPPGRPPPAGPAVWRPPPAGRPARPIHGSPATRAGPPPRRGPSRRSNPRTGDPRGHGDERGRQHGGPQPRRGRGSRSRAATRRSSPGPRPPTRSGTRPPTRAIRVDPQQGRPQQGRPVGTAAGLPVRATLDLVGIRSRGTTTAAATDALRRRPARRRPPRLRGPARARRPANRGYDEPRGDDRRGDRSAPGYTSRRGYDDRRGYDGPPPGYGRPQQGHGRPRNPALDEPTDEVPGVRRGAAGRDPGRRPAGTGRATVYGAPRRWTRR